MRPSSPLSAIAVLFFSLALTGCLFRSHSVPANLSKAPLQTATEQQLAEKLNHEADVIHTMNASVEIATSVGGAKKGKVTEYSAINGFILAEKPAMLRMIGLLPIVRNRAFDMVSNGQTFELWIPPKNRFIVGSNEVTKPSTNTLENLRPQVILDALLFQPVQPDDIAVLEARMQTVVDEQSKKRVEQPNYVLDIIHQDPSSGRWYLSRKLYFNRSNLLPYRQLLFNKAGTIATDAQYGNFRNFGGISFPMHIIIHRPEEEYTVGIKVLKLTLNQPLKPEQFVLEQPEGAQVVRLDGSTAAVSSPPTGNPNE